MRESTRKASRAIYVIDRDFGMVINQYTIGIVQNLTEFVNRQEDYMPDIEFSADEILGRSGTLTELLEIVDPKFDSDRSVIAQVINILDEWGNEVLEFNRKLGFDRHQAPLVSELRKQEKSAVMCEHANEVPGKCNCPNDCYCKSLTCKSK